MQDIKWIIDSLEKSAETDEDLTDAIYAGFFNDCAAAVPLMGHSDQHMRGRMLEQVYELLMDELLQGEGGYFQWEIENHLTAYGVEVDMYEAFLNAVRDAVRENLASSWLPEHDIAWASRISALFSEVAAQQHHSGSV